MASLAHASDAAIIAPLSESAANITQGFVVDFLSTSHLTAHLPSSAAPAMAAGDGARLISHPTRD